MRDPRFQNESVTSCVILFEACSVFTFIITCILVPVWSANSDLFEIGFRCELCGGQVDRVEINADHREQSFQRAAAPGRIDHFMRALVPAVPAFV
jgi:hypothetical protein